MMELFGSNSGGKAINTKLSKAINTGVSREALSLKEMEDVLSKDIFQMKSDELFARERILRRVWLARWRSGGEQAHHA